MKLLMFLRGLWDYYVVGTWLSVFPPKSENTPGDDVP